MIDLSRVLVALIAGVPPTFAVFVSWRQQNRKQDAAQAVGNEIKTTVQHARAEIGEVHSIADGRLTEALEAIDMLKKEIMRLNVDRRATPMESETSKVTMDEGVVSTKKPAIRKEKK